MGDFVAPSETQSRCCAKCFRIARRASPKQDGLVIRPSVPWSQPPIPWIVALESSCTAFPLGQPHVRRSAPPEGSDRSIDKSIGFRQDPDFHGSLAAEMRRKHEGVFAVEEFAGSIRTAKGLPPLEAAESG